MSVRPVRPKDLPLIWKFVRRTKRWKCKIFNGQIFDKDSSKSWALLITSSLSVEFFGSFENFGRLLFEFPLQIEQKSQLFHYPLEPNFYYNYIWCFHFLSKNILTFRGYVKHFYELRRSIKVMCYFFPIKTQSLFGGHFITFCERATENKSRRPQFYDFTEKK